MSQKDIIDLAIVGVILVCIVVFTAVGTLAIYFEAVKPHLKKYRPIIGVQFTIQREREVKE